MIQVTRTLSINKNEIRFTYGTSSGPGGQHVNRVETKATLLFSVDASTSLSERQKAYVKLALKTRINKAGILRVSSSKHKSQLANRKAATQRFAELIAISIQPPMKRHKTKVPKSQKKKRLALKRKRSEQKRLRSQVEPSSD